ncbi:NlpC/P60 family protein [Clostridium paraputrificum]|mgnify:FL=1|uniref:C40 family peptidase n=2 Tax=Clostridium TaxID=1485 RepID=UPI00066712E2|nr:MULTISPECIES: C40 family peptidase [Clostridium]MBS7132488.1 C40 family peptidase [Clostridium sp.]MDB2074861.1 NlpC/P60 family protein [Clostridium paraputrificum]MDB2085976.1 NlpC/P60 family protein [Clostridium paraputrificum]MDB2094347.1 NlpC/P60 family protein [Clostridium paraputrificum]MDB2101273.1 NlpC/P60 family protein [Clostridium paraputrificum]
MKKKVLSAIVAGIMAITLIVPPMAVSATPDNGQVQEARQKYEELTKKINEIDRQIQVLDNQIVPLVEKINSNKNEISNINREIDNANKEIEQAEEDIAGQEELLGKRLRELYKSGGQTSYISLIFSAESFSDLITKIDSASRLVKLDQQVVEELLEKQEQLDEKVKSLEVKGEEIKKINEDIQKKLQDFEAKKDEQQVLIDQAESEQKEFDRLYLADLEREIVKGLVNICYDSSNSRQSLENAVFQLRALRKGQLKSPIVDSEVVDAIENAKKLIEKKKAEEAAANAPNRGNGSTVTGSASAILNEAYKHIGKPYVWGATGPNSFDCSGFTSYVYRNAAGVNIGRTTKNQIYAGREVSRSELQPGDLVFPHADHVGIYVGDGKMIHSPKPGKSVEVIPMYGFWRARRILN